MKKEIYGICIAALLAFGACATDELPTPSEPRLETPEQNEPVSGEVLEFNEAVDADPSIVNKDAFGEGWLVKVRMSAPEEYDKLLTPAQYEELIG